MRPDWSKRRSNAASVSFNQKNNLISIKMKNNASSSAIVRALKMVHELDKVTPELVVAENVTPEPVVAEPVVAEPVVAKTGKKGKGKSMGQVTAEIEAAKPVVPAVPKVIEKPILAQNTAEATALLNKKKGATKTSTTAAKEPKKDKATKVPVAKKEKAQTLAQFVDTVILAGGTWDTMLSLINTHAEEIGAKMRYNKGGINLHIKLRTAKNANYLSTLNLKVTDNGIEVVVAPVVLEETDVTTEEKPAQKGKGKK